MSLQNKRRSTAKSRKKLSRPFAFQAYPVVKEIEETIREAARRRGMNVSTFLIQSALKEAKSA